MPTVSLLGTDKDGNIDPEKSVDYEIDSRDTIYIELENLDKILPHGCLAGSCGACRISIFDGAENLSPAGPVEQDTIDHIKNNYRKTFGEEYLEGKCIRMSCKVKLLQGKAAIAPLK